ncbi:hypothetical protein [Phreatobacter sp.]|uniref:hypothetical protein n=1 Tax=Phreatobacter sp. TaxID=1966341 RepID=UPI003F6FA6A4
MSIYGLAARAVMFAASGPPSELSIAGAALGYVAPGRQFTQGAVGVLRVLDTLVELNKVAKAVSSLARRGADTAAEDMVRLMRERGPDDTFRLERGTRWRREGDIVVVEARALRAAMAGEEDYAPFVEWGTEHAGRQPFFWDSAREVMEATRRRFAEDLDRLADEFNG